MLLIAVLCAGSGQLLEPGRGSGHRTLHRARAPLGGSVRRQLHTHAKQAQQHPRVAARAAPCRQRPMGDVSHRSTDVPRGSCPVQRPQGALRDDGRQGRHCACVSRIPLSSACACGIQCAWGKAIGPVSTLGYVQPQSGSTSSVSSSSASSSGGISALQPREPAGEGVQQGQRQFRQQECGQRDGWPAVWGGV
jgi:hypothetical protein